MDKRFPPGGVLRSACSFWILLIVGGLLTSGYWPPDLLAAQGERKAQAAPVNPFPNRIRAPELEGGTGYLNASGEVTLRDLRGKVVALDFWTYCCINCIHVLPDLKFLERKYANELVVVGIHSAKFENEKDSDHIRSAIQRYEIEHPVINDSQMRIWSRYGINSWPSLVLIDPEGFVVGIARGEGNRDVLDQAIAKLIAFHRAKGTLDETPVRFDLELAKLEPTPLRFPGKVLADEKGNRLFISDSNHNRIVISTLDGQLLDVIGTGVVGEQDGAYDEAQFDHPQGMALDGETLYVADTENHLIRSVDLTKKTVSTLAGTGRQGTFRDVGGPRALKATALNSPWDLCVLNGMLYVAMAGPHQIWFHKLGTDRIGPFAGSGKEDILDGPVDDAALAQPSGLATDGVSLYVVDSEGSAVRKIGTRGRREVTTVVGPSDLPGGRSLFEFGDRDGVGSEVRLQHPLGIVYHDGALLVADSYNHKIKRIDLKTRRATTWLGMGIAGDSVDPPQLSEPAGLTIAKRRLYIADTNNHRICVADLSNRKMSVLTIEGLTPPELKSEPEPLAADAREIKVPAQTVAAGDELKFAIHFRLPEGFKLNALAPIKYTLSAVGSQELIASEQLDARREAEPDENSTVVAIPLAQKSGKATLRLALSYSYCRDGVGGVCKFDSVKWLIPVEVTADASETSISLSAGP